MNREDRAISIIKKKLKVLNLSVLLSITTVLLLVVKFVYSTLGFLNIHSILAILATVSLLTFCIYHLSKQATRTAIQTIEGYANRLSLLRDSVEGIHGIGHSDLIMEHVIASSLALTGAEGASLLVLDNDKLRFQIVEGEASEELQGTFIPRSKGIVGWVIDNGEAAIINDTEEDERHYMEVDKATGFATRSILCVPIQLNERVFGAIELVSSRPGAFTEEERDILECFCTHAALSIRDIKGREEQQNLEVHLTSILVDANENIAGKKGHIRRVAKYALMIGHELHFSDDELATLHRAAMLHDIGFLRMRPEDIHSAADYRAHSRLGYEFLRQITAYSDIAPIVLHHHERYDGTGYPGQLKGDDIPIMSRVIAIAEAFDAMTNHNSYKRVGKLISDDVIPDTVDSYRAILELKACAGTQFDPCLVDAFVNSLDHSDYDVLEGQVVHIESGRN